MLAHTFYSFSSSVVKYWMWQKLRMQTSYNVCPDFGLLLYMYLHLPLGADESLDSHGSSSLLFMINVMVWHFVSTLIRLWLHSLVPPIVVLGISLQFLDIFSEVQILESGLLITSGRWSYASTPSFRSWWSDQCIVMAAGYCYYSQWRKWWSDTLSHSHKVIFEVDVSLQYH